MDRVDNLGLDGAFGRLRAVECAIQALILTHPDPAAFGETLHDLVRSLRSRPDEDQYTAHVGSSQGFREVCDEFGRAAEVAISARLAPSTPDSFPA